MRRKTDSDTNPIESIASRGVLSVKNTRLHIINHTSQIVFDIQNIPKDEEHVPEFK
jgi:hypothetical protein